MTIRATNPDVKAKLLRDRSPEARALGGWYVEMDTPLRGYEHLSTDWCRSATQAMSEARRLALALGFDLTPAAR